MDSTGPALLAEVAALRARLWGAGFRPVPIHNAILGDKASGKRPWGDKWQIDAERDPPRAVTDPPRPEALGTGIYCAGFRGIDLDIDNPTLAHACLDHAAAVLGTTAMRTRAGSARCLLFYRAAEGAPRKLTLAGRLGKIEALGAGQQFVAFGTHYEHLATLQWEPHPPGVEMADDLPAVTEAAVAEFLRRCAPIIDARFENRTNGADPHPPASWDPADGLELGGGLTKPGQLLATVTRGTGGWHDAMIALVGRWVRMGLTTPEILAYAPTLTREGFTVGQTVGELRAAMAGAVAKGWGTPDLEPSDGEAGPQPLTATPFDPALLKTLEPRQWVYGHFLIRRFLSVLGAPGGIGKTAYAMAVGISVALDEPLLGETVHDPGAVWLYNLEDPQDEILRRVQAIILQHQIDPAALVDRLYLDSGRDHPLIVASRLADGTVIATPLVEALIAELHRRAIKLLIVDPFVRSHSLEENRTEHIDFAAALWNRVADRANCAILLVHHFRKGGTGGDVDAFRGSSSLVWAGRAAITLTVMSEAEAGTFGVAVGDRRQYLRLDDAKLNLSRPPADVPWFELNGVALPNGDNVQAVSRWRPPSVLEGVNMAMIVRIMDRLTAGPEEGEQYTLTRRGQDNARWAGTVVAEITGKSEQQAAAMLRTWATSTPPLLAADRYHSAKNRKDVGGLTVNAATLAKMRQQATEASDSQGY